ncbi:MAG TPA: YggS family pyridoxal phosphate-dependent enzyme [Candidatus Kapabacteria bacterium]|nr:YggS family pyridoxal phosphate-dependent enzyme [Candidatus Kapabacteria bacterium]
MATTETALQAIQQRIRLACEAAGRTAQSVRLIAVSKTFPAADVRALAAAGQRAFGENYVQEAIAKMAELHDLALEWHFIGPLQSNKTRAIAEQCNWVHSLDRLRIAQRLSDQRPLSMDSLRVLLQVNISGEASKSGCTPEELPALAAAVAQLPRLQLLGLMTVPEPTPDVAVQRARFARLRQLRDSLQQQLGLALPELSMGMSADLEAAIGEGATLVRVGTALFGARSYAPSSTSSEHKDPS